VRQGGHHLILDLEGCDTRLLDSPRAMARLCLELARVLGVRVLDTRSFKFQPQGVTAFCVLAESHISIHTWPEAGKACLDIFSCQSQFRGHPATYHALAFLRAKRGTLTHLVRDAGRSWLRFHGLVDTDGAGFEFGPTIFAHQSPFQSIELTKGPLGVSLFLDGYWQFVERYERAYHETLVHPAAVCARQLRKVGIAGGGDGLALREVLKHPTLRQAVMYELDPAVLGLADGHPELLRLNERALRHPKAHVVADDAQKMLRPGADFDVLIIDFPSVNEGVKVAHLYSVAFYERVRRALAPGGVVAVQITDYPQTVDLISRRLQRLFRHVRAVEVGKARFAMYSFVLASDLPFQQRRPLPRGLRFMNRRQLAILLNGPVAQRRAA